ncbi:putative uncharacterized protein DDB_G0272516 [Bactrocera dorsalis]|uniref:Uncharacterized protein n=1 Tax=Bactrocera dorsalis TaxID=27457 RepID=A0ABM3IYI2_BACDO|nr:putative uncharacterized protein DDB_G0272516 [Bactrocera dorsalis]
MYVDSMDSVVPRYTTISSEEAAFYFNCVTCTLRGSALDIVRREQPCDWTTLRQLLIDEFGEHTPVSTLILEISNIKFKNSVKLLCEEINIEVCRVKDCIKLKNENISTKTFLYKELDQISLKTLKRELPNYLTALINANLVTDLKSAVKILKENNVFEDDRRLSKTKQNHNQRNIPFPRVPNFSHINSNRENGNEFQHFCPSNVNRFFDYSHDNNYQGYALPPNNANHFYHSNPNGWIYHPQMNTTLNCPNSYTNRNNFNAHNDNNVPKINSQQTRRQNESNSNQSRIRRYGAPQPMEFESSNFQLEASEDYQQ